MSIIINGKESFIIDRTLMSITEKSFDENKLLQFTINLKRLGVDFFEIDERTFNLVKPLMTSEAFIFRIDAIHQLEICKANKIKYIVVKDEDLKFIKIKDVEEKYNFKIILEIDASLYQGNYIEMLNKNIDINSFFSVRLKGVSNWFFNDFIQGKFTVKTNIYASDKLYMATAVGFQAILKRFDYITTAFCGKDGANGTTALEEILIFAKVIMDGEVNGKISLLSEMREQYEKITYIQLPNNKSIIGRDIFKYESGVHVAGIEKNPVTYEPFMPELVGMKRKLALGKHSGKNSISSKLKELDIENKFTVGEIITILNKVKNKSILNKAEVSDKEFIDICREIEG
jgi:homocitrate synthase NifV